MKEEVLKKYSLLDGYPLKGGHPKFGVVDLREIDLQGADNLYAGGFEGLVLKPTKEAKEPKENK